MHTTELLHSITDAYFAPLVSSLHMRTGHTINIKNIQSHEYMMQIGLHRTQDPIYILQNDSVNSICINRKLYTQLFNTHLKIFKLDLIADFLEHSDSANTKKIMNSFINNKELNQTIAIYLYSQLDLKEKSYCHEGNFLVSSITNIGSRDRKLYLRRIEA
jgi:hypothetical protein